jgi:hypothetical protein
MRNCSNEPGIIGVAETNMIAAQSGHPTASEERLPLPGRSLIAMETGMDIGEKIVLMISHKKHICGVFMM